jgi:hypothetical protein
MTDKAMHEHQKAVRKEHDTAKAATAAVHRHEAAQNAEKEALERIDVSRLS